MRSCVLLYGPMIPKAAFARRGNNVGGLKVRVLCTYKGSDAVIVGDHKRITGVGEMTRVI